MIQNAPTVNGNSLRTARPARRTVSLPWQLTFHSSDQVNCCTSRASSRDEQRRWINWCVVPSVQW